MTREDNPWCKYFNTYEEYERARDFYWFIMAISDEKDGIHPMKDNVPKIKREDGYSWTKFHELMQEKFTKTL